MKRQRPTIDLDTPEGRKQADYDLMWGDHGFLRLRFRNMHQISNEMWRTNQPSPKQIAEHASERGIKTILNLRGASPKGYYLLEKEACAEHGVELVDYQMYSRDTPTVEKVLGARDLFDSIAYPALMHCKSGADRAGIMAVLYMHFRQGQPIEQAIEQLSFKYLHVREGKTGMLDYMFQRYLDYSEQTPISFVDWIEGPYDREAIKADFMRTWKAKLMMDRILRRE